MESGANSSHIVYHIWSTQFAVLLSMECRSYVVGTVAIRKPECHVWKVSHCGRSRAAITLCVRWSSCSIVHTLILAEVTRHDRSIIACSRHIYVVLFFAHIPYVVKHAFSAMPAESLQQRPLLFTTNRTNHTFFWWWLSHSTTFASWSQHHFVANGKPEWQVHKASHCGRSCAAITLHVRWTSC